MKWFNQHTLPKDIEIGGMIKLWLNNYLDTCYIIEKTYKDNTNIPMLILKNSYGTECSAIWSKEQDGRLYWRGLSY